MSIHPSVATAAYRHGQHRTRPTTAMPPASGTVQDVEHPGAGSTAEDRATNLGRRLADLIDEPDEFASVLRDGFAALRDPAHAALLERMAPGIGPHLGVRAPLQRATLRALRGRFREASAAECIWLAERLRHEELHEVRAVALPLLRRSLEDDPERSWQLLREFSRNRSCWVDVDELAGPYALGILLEPYRWAELEQLVYSPDRWERRLVGATIASLPFEVIPIDRPRLAAGSPALELIGMLVGDAEPIVQKALGWALRAWHRVDPAGVELLLREETTRASEERDGNRAWVVRDASSVLAPNDAAILRARLRALRRSASDTSRAHAAARMFADLIEAGPTGPPATPTQE